MPTFAALGLSRRWDPADREAVRAVNSEYWPRVRARLREGYSYDTPLTDIPAFRDMVRDAVLHDGWGAEDLAVWFGVSGARARAWVKAVMTEAELEDCGQTSWRGWLLDRFGPVSGDVAKNSATRDVQKERRRLDVARLRDFVEVHGVVPNAGDLAAFLGESYQAIGNRWPGTYAQGWNALYAEAGYTRPGAYGACV